MILHCRDYALASWGTQATLCGEKVTKLDGEYYVGTDRLALFWVDIDKVTCDLCASKRAVLESAGRWPI